MRIPAPFAAALLLLTSAPAFALAPPCSTVCAKRIPPCEEACSINGVDTTCREAVPRCIETLGVNTEKAPEEATQVCREGHPDGEQPQTAEG
ncbi:hypothetical protein [Corallococcus sp. EGB]|uniref:hypothetical protein n=1 Tax=Corallococcus sp. EGB TaxID=1521117 RepID=UPI001CC0BB9A|nr:hypothetical protein [Corallococcus sp. EGB]